MSAVRASVHDSTGYSPFRMLYGREAVVPLTNNIKVYQTYENERDCVTATAK
jgi:hypothetical protein